MGPPTRRPGLAALRAPTTTKASHPHVTLSTASARRGRLPSALATCSFRRDRTYMVGMASTLMMLVKRLRFESGLRTLVIG